jgi:hypothetical protein
MSTNTACVGADRTLFLVLTNEYLIGRHHNSKHLGGPSTVKSFKYLHQDVYTRFVVKKRVGHLRVWLAIRPFDNPQHPRTGTR